MFIASVYFLTTTVDPGYFEGVKKVLHFGTVQKELVDPYCTVSFAGKKGKTPVIWNEQDPEWNHQISLGIRVSSSSLTACAVGDCVHACVHACACV